MKKHVALLAGIAAVAALAAGYPAIALGQGAAAAPAAAAKLPADPWPRDVTLSNAALLVYQPQVNTWDGNQIDFRAALAIKPKGATDEAFGVIFATARTQVDKVARTVVFENLKITKSDFPTLPDRGAQYAAELQTRIAADVRTISLDRLTASLALAGVKPPTVAVQNNPPQVLVSYSPAMLVPIDGAPVLKPAPNSTRFQRVINTRALILQGGFGNKFYIHVYDGWLAADTIAGPWSQVFMGPLRAERRQRDRAAAREGRHGRPARRRPEGQSQAVARQRRPDDLHQPGADRADRVQGPAGLRADRRHRPAVGVEHDQRRADQHGQQRLLRAARRAVVQGARRCPGRGPTSPATRCRPISRRSRRTRSRAPCCRRWRGRRRRRPR